MRKRNVVCGMVDLVVGLYISSLLKDVILNVLNSPANKNQFVSKNFRFFWRNVNAGK